MSSASCWLAFIRDEILSYAELYLEGDAVLLAVGTGSRQKYITLFSRVLNFPDRLLPLRKLKVLETRSNFLRAISRCYTLRITGAIAGYSVNNYRKDILRQLIIDRYQRFNRGDIFDFYQAYIVYSLLVLVLNFSWYN